MRWPRFESALVVLVLAAGCNALWDSGGYTFVDQTGGDGGGASGGTGGVGGVGGTTGGDGGMAGPGGDGGNGGTIMCTTYVDSFCGECACDSCIGQLGGCSEGSDCAALLTCILQNGCCGDSVCTEANCQTELDAAGPPGTKGFGDCLETSCGCCMQ